MQGLQQQSIQVSLTTKLHSTSGKMPRQLSLSATSTVGNFLKLHLISIKLRGTVVPHTSEFMGKTFQAAQLWHEIFLTPDHSCKIFFWYLPNGTSTDLWCVVLYATYSTTHQRSVGVQFGRYQKNILQEWSMVKNLSCVSCAAWNVFPVNSLLPAQHKIM